MAMVRNVMFFLAIAAMLMTVANATDYSVVWSTGIDYADWAAGKTFKVGDIIHLNYTSNHNVYHVSKQGYDTCSTSSAISSDNSGYTLFIITGLGKGYLICGKPGHCERGMKMEIEVTGYSYKQPPPPPSSAYRISTASSFAFALLMILVAI